MIKIFWSLVLVLWRHFSREQTSSSFLWQLRFFLFHSTWFLFLFTEIKQFNTYRAKYIRKKCLYSFNVSCDSKIGGLVLLICFYLGEINGIKLVYSNIPLSNTNMKKKNWICWMQNCVFCQLLLSLAFFFPLWNSGYLYWLPSLSV